MARSTPKQANRVARPGHLFPSEALARNVRAYRQFRGMKQEDVDKGMAMLGLRWSVGTVGFVERRDRAVGVDELVPLAIVLGVPIGALLDPTGPEGRDGVGWELGTVALNPPESHGLARGWRSARLDQEASTPPERIAVTTYPEPDQPQGFEAYRREYIEALARRQPAPEPYPSGRESLEEGARVAQLAQDAAKQRTRREAAKRTRGKR